MNEKLSSDFRLNEMKLSFKLSSLCLLSEMALLLSPAYEDPIFPPLRTTNGGESEKEEKEIG